MFPGQKGPHDTFSFFAAKRLAVINTLTWHDRGSRVSFFLFVDFITLTRCLQSGFRNRTVLIMSGWIIVEPFCLAEHEQSGLMHSNLDSCSSLKAGCIGSKHGADSPCVFPCVLKYFPVL